MRSALLAIGVLLLATAAILKFVVLPSQAKFPDDVDATSVYEGTLAVTFDTDALARGDIADLFVRDVPVTIENRTEVLATDGDLALVETNGVVTAPDGSVVRTSDGLYAIDRVSMLTTTAHEWAEVPAREPGIVTGFPIGTEARDYEAWSDEIGQLVTLTYDRTEERAGVETHVFTRAVRNQVVVDEATLALVPDALPKDLVVQLAGALDLPAAFASQFDALLPQLPDPVPLGLVYSAETTLWVEPTTGVVIDIEASETRAAYLDVDLIPIVLPVVDVWDWTYAPTDATVAEAVTTAQDASGTLTLFGTTLPVALVILGLALLSVAVLRGRQSETADAPADRGFVDAA